MTMTPQHAARRRMYRRRRWIVGIVAVIVLALIAAAAFAVITYVDANNGIRRSSIAGVTGPKQNTGESNILIMGLDSRVDVNGKPFPQAIYDQIHAEDASVGGYNTNVLMLIHIPANGGKAVGISIPRDDYVDFPDAPGGVEKGKIKEAYGDAMNASLQGLSDKGVPEADAYQQARTAARQSTIKTVSEFLGGVRIDHFVEVTMAAFYEVAEAVQPITVCLNHATADTFSGADFPAGVQQLNAAQSMAFVRQRRDTTSSDFELTDLDRTRRQQAFIVSLAVKLRQASTFTDFGKLQKLIDVAKKDVAMDDDLDLLSFAQQAQSLAGGNISFVTLPIDHFDTVDGQDVNIVDVDAIRAQVHDLLNPPTATPTASPTPSASGSGSPSSGSGSSGSSGSTPAPHPVYTDSSTPLQSGNVPCVN
ncbi:Cell envelope-related function transcriptional attenuator common domain-containing protein [Microbacterium sp. 8M]|uniref:LCP family protein n=1 Tax=Microbacterium sp. 8M TaxID=2653153 RepID=UPI0012EF64B4|nr:LCP family protein [Microbacterium sp. 8M]VXB65594.1 Cell envelope-related function transcriptional attenuator common domain-containing protein [Microbacterium sp. 8M]